MGNEYESSLDNAAESLLMYFNEHGAHGIQKSMIKRSIDLNLGWLSVVDSVFKRGDSNGNKDQ